MSESLHELPSNTLLGRVRASRCSVDMSGSCTRVLVTVVETNSSASVASPHRIVHLLFHDLRLIGNSLHVVLRVFTLSQLVVLLSVTSGQLARLFVSSETCIRSPMFFGTCGLLSSRPRGRLSVGLVIGCPIPPGSMIVTFLLCER